MAQRRVNIEYTPKDDEWYYGPINLDTTLEPTMDKNGVKVFHTVRNPLTWDRLADIMAKGVIRFHLDMLAETGTSDSLEAIVEEDMERWFEHDSVKEDTFDHLVPENRWDEFCDLVLQRAYSILGT